jgi:hypothetical protein
MLISHDVQQEELWDFNAMRNVASEVKAEECAFR